MRNFMSSANEAELRGLFENCQKAKSMRTALSEMVHLQPPTPVATYNIAVKIIMNGASKKKEPEQ